jgi:S1-C subfamily serine protease
MWLEFRSGADTGKRVQVSGARFTVGREGAVNLIVNDTKVSRQHAYFQALPDGRVALYDEGSSNGTFVNGQRIQSVTLSGGETVQFGDTVLSVTRDGAPAYNPTQPAAPQAPTPQPIAAGSVGAPPARTQSAIQRIVLQRSINRATWIGVAAIVLLVAVGGLLAVLLLTGEDEQPGAPSRAQIIQDVTPLTTFIGSESGVGRSRGTGWIYDAPNGYVVSNAHVVAGGQSFTVGVNTPSGPKEVPAQLVGCRLSEDISVLQLGDNDRAGLKQFALADQSKLRVGDDVVAVGYPEGGGGFEAKDLTGTTGVISIVKTTFPSIPISEDGSVVVGPYQNVLQTDAAVNPGNSGGPLVNDKRELVGINSAGRERNANGNIIQGQSFAIGTDQIKKVVPELINTKSNDCQDVG